MRSPVIWADAGDARKSARSATASGPGGNSSRGTGVQFLSLSGGIIPNCFCPSAAIKPGTMQLTLILCCAHLAAEFFVRLMTPVPFHQMVPVDRYPGPLCKVLLLSSRCSNGLSGKNTRSYLRGEYRSRTPSAWPVSL